MKAPSILSVNRDFNARTGVRVANETDFPAYRSYVVEEIGSGPWQTVPEVYDRRIWEFLPTPPQWASTPAVRVQHEGSEQDFSSLPPSEEEDETGPTQTKCVFRGPNSVEVNEATLRNAIAAVAKSERTAWLSKGSLQKEDVPSLFPQLVRHWLAGKDSTLPPDTLQLLQTAALTASASTYSNVLDATLNKAMEDFNDADARFETAVEDRYKKFDDVDAAKRDLAQRKTEAAAAEAKARGSDKLLAQAKNVVDAARKAQPFSQADLDAAKKAESAAQQDHDTNVSARKAAIDKRSDAATTLTEKTAELAESKTGVAALKQARDNKIAAASNWSTAARKKAREELIKSASVASTAGINSFIDSALLAAHKSRADVEAWSAVFVSSCVRGAAIGLKLEVKSGGIHHGKDHLLKASQKHAEYIVDARDKPAPGRYQAFDPGKRAVAVGDIVCTDRTDFIAAAGRHTLKGLTTGTLLHGDIVVEVQKKGSNPYVETIGGNVRHTARKRRYPLDSSGRLIMSETLLIDQEDDAGTFQSGSSLGPFPALSDKPSMVHRQSTFRIFALLSPVGICDRPTPKSETSVDYAPPSWLKVQPRSRSSDSVESLDVTLTRQRRMEIPGGLRG